MQALFSTPCTALSRELFLYVRQKLLLATETPTVLTLPPLPDCGVACVMAPRGHLRCLHAACTMREVHAKSSQEQRMHYGLRRFRVHASRGSCGMHRQPGRLPRRCQPPACPGTRATARWFTVHVSDCVRTPSGQTPPQAFRVTPCHPRPSPRSPWETPLWAHRGMADICLRIGHLLFWGSGWLRGPWRLFRKVGAEPLLHKSDDGPENS